MLKNLTMNESKRKSIFSFLPLLNIQVGTRIRTFSNFIVFFFISALFFFSQADTAMSKVLDRDRTNNNF